MRPWASPRHPWWRATRRWPNASPSSTNGSVRRLIVEQYIEGREILRRRARQRPPPRAADLGIAVWPMWRRARGHDRHREGQARSRLSGAPRRGGGAGQGPAGRVGRASTAWSSVSAGRWNSTDTPASISGSPPTAPRISIEANPNPEIAKVEEFAQSALHDGLKYPDLLNRILPLGMARGPVRRCGAVTQIIKISIPADSSA